MECEKMSDEKISEKIIDNIGKYLGLNGTYKDGFIYFPLTKTYDSKILKTILTHYDARCYINTTKETFVLVVF